MKIETTVKSHVNQTVKYSDGIRATYDNQCIAEVSDADGKALIEKYIGQIYEAGKVPKPGMVRSAPVKTEGGNAELKEALQKANSLIADYKAKAQAALDGEKVWRNKCDELSAEIVALKAQLGVKPADIEPNQELSPEEKAVADQAILKATLEAKTVKQLLAYAVELKLPVEEYKGKNKEDLINYLINKTNVPAQL